jgi:hypothetical protein
MSKNSKLSVHTACIVYKVSYHKEHHGISPSLVDRGASGGVARNDVRVIFKTNCTVYIKGIDNHCCTSNDIGTVGGVIHTNKGPVIGIMHQYDLLNKGSSIHSPCQCEWYKMTLMINPFLSQEVSNVYRRSTAILYPLVSKTVLHILTYAHTQTKNLTHYPMSSLHPNWNGTHLF